MSPQRAQFEHDFYNEDQISDLTQVTLQGLADVVQFVLVLSQLASCDSAIL